jgi:tetratricopeptide (TPR) repeat protein
MSLKEDIEAIKAKLTGDKKKDIDILFSAADQYANRPYSKELDLEISDLINEITQDCDDKTLKELSVYISRRSTVSYEKNLLSIRDAIDKKHDKKALQLADKTEAQVLASMEEARSASPDAPITYRYCFSPMEFSLANRYYPVKNVIQLPFDYVSLLTLKGQALYYSNRVDEAVLTIRKAFEYDPVSPDISFLLADIDAVKGNWISYSMNLDRAHQFLYKREDVKRYYFYVAQYFRLCLQDPETSKNLITAFSGKELPYQILRKLPTKTLNILKEKEIPLDASDEVISTALREVRSANAMKDKETYDYYYGILSDFRMDSELDFLLTEEAGFPRKGKYPFDL